jgi:hypothetical protein
MLSRGDLGGIFGRMRILMFALLVACSSSSSTPTSTPTPTPTPPTEAPPAGGVMTKEECEAQGGRVNASIGGGEQAHCNADESELAPVRLGIEGGWCCKKK